MHQTLCTSVSLCLYFRNKFLDRKENRSNSSLMQNPNVANVQNSESETCVVQKLLYICISKEKLMTQFVVTLENNANTSLLRRMIENMKGVLNVSVSRSSKDVDEETKQWIDKMNYLGNSIDSSILDMNDDRTKYILGK